MRNDEIASALRELYDRLLLAGASIFKVAAFKKAAEAIAAMPFSVEKLAAEDRLTEIDGVGAGIAEKINQLIATGTFDDLEQARADVPDGLLTLVSVPGIGKGKATKIWAQLEAEVFEDVLAAANNGRLESLSGVGGSLVKALKDFGETMYDDPEETVGSKDLLRNAAATIVDVIATFASELGGGGTVWTTGDLAQGKETIADLSVLVVAEDIAAMEQDLLTVLVDAGWEVAAGSGADARELSFAAANGASGVVRLCLPGAAPSVFVSASSPEPFSDALSNALGSKSLPEVSIDSGLTPPDRVLFEEIGAQYVPVELRHLDAVLDSAIAGDLEELVVETDLRAELHCHSKWSDGKSTILEMAMAAHERGDTHMVITDHSAPYALVNGLDGKRLAAQAQEIASANAHFGGEFTVLRGTEVEIQADGSLGLENDVLEQLDWVVASIHMQPKQAADVINARIERAIRNPYVDCIAHPTSRLLLRRAPTALSVERLIELAVETGTVLEINANPQRLDLGADHARAALAAGVRLAIDSDAHHVAALSFRTHGVAVARRAGVAAANVVNCLGIESLLASRKREQASKAMA